MQSEFETDQATATWVLTAFLVSAAVAAPILGRLGDLHGKRRMLVFSLLALSFGSCVAATADSIGVMIVARAIQGLGGGTMPLSIAIIRDVLPPNRVPAAVSFTNSLFSLGFATGLVVAGPIVEGLGLHWVFILPAVLSATAALTAVLLIPDSPVRSEGRLPILPAILLTGWLVSLLIGLTKAPVWGWLSPQVLGLGALAMLLLASWILVETLHESPLVDLRLMLRRGVWTANAVALLIGAVGFGGTGFLPQFNQTPSDNGYGFGVSLAEAGHMMLPALTCSFLCGLGAAWVIRTVGLRRIVAIGCVISVVAMMAICLAHEQKWQMYVTSALVGIGTGFVFAYVGNVVVAAVPEEFTGVAAAMNFNFKSIGNALGSALMTTAITSSTLPSGYPAESGYVAGFAILAAVAAVAVAVALLIPRGLVPSTAAVLKPQ